MSCIPCSSCGNCSPCNPCNRCGSNCYTVVTSGCPIQLDFSCILYHKSNNEVTELDGLNLANGSTLQLVIETLDEKIKQLNVLDLTLTYLRTKYTVNTMQQFVTAVETELSELNDRVTALEP